MSSPSRSVNITGFQYEPEWSDTEEGSRNNHAISYKDDDEVVPLEHSKPRSSENLNTWCQCGRCKALPTTQECLCCIEIDEIKYHHLGGKFLLCTVS